MLLFYNNLLSNLLLKRRQLLCWHSGQRIIICAYATEIGCQDRWTNWTPTSGPSTPPCCTWNTSFPESHLLPSLLLLLLLLPSSLPPVWAQIPAVPLLRTPGTLDCTRCLCVHKAAMPTAWHAHCLPPIEPVVLSSCLALLPYSCTSSLSHHTSLTENKIKDRIKNFKILEQSIKSRTRPF